MVDTAELGSQPKKTLHAIFDFLDVSQPDMDTWPMRVFRRRCPRFFGITSSKQYQFHKNDASASLGSSATPVEPNVRNDIYNNADADGIKDCESYLPMRNETRCVAHEQLGLMCRSVIYDAHLSPVFLLAEIFFHLEGLLCCLYFCLSFSAALEKFYAPHNARLYKLLEKNYGW